MENNTLTLEHGVHSLRITPMNEFLSKKNMIRIECIDDCTDGQDIDGNWIEEYECATFDIYSLEELELIISKLETARRFLKQT